MLEANFTVWLINAPHVKNGPGRKTAVKYLRAQYPRIAARRGSKRAALAVAHSIGGSAYYILTRREAYHELGGAYLKEQPAPGRARRLVKQIEQLGYWVQIEPVAQPT